MEINHREIHVITWCDAVADCGWEDVVEASSHTCVTVGFVVAESEDVICIASTVSGEDTNCRIHIPKKWVLSNLTINLVEGEADLTNED